MITSAEKTRRNSTGNVRLEVVDSWHKEWPTVLNSIDRVGQKQSLLLDDDGWLSARQSVLAAFVDEKVVGHLCFRVEPLKSHQGKVVLEAQLDSFSVESDYNHIGVDQLLVDKAESHAKMLQCRTFRCDPIGEC